MPCDSKMHYGRFSGTDTLVNRMGEVVKCTIDDSLRDDTAEVTGWMPHWATCKNAGEMRKHAKPQLRKRKPQAKPATNGQKSIFEMR